MLGINRLWPRNPVNWRFRCYDVDLQSMKPVEIEQPAGAFMMIRRDAWERVGGFDESFYPLWFEDVDFCCRLKLAGLRLFHVPSADCGISDSILFVSYNCIIEFIDVLVFLDTHPSTSIRSRGKWCAVPWWQAQSFVP